jgi:hypothetical protein
MPVSRDPEKRARQLANLRPAPAAPAGHSRSLVHGGRAEVLFRDVSDEVRELLDVLGELAPESTNASLDFHGGGDGLLRCRQGFCPTASMQSGSPAAPRSRGLDPTPALTPQAA